MAISSAGSRFRRVLRVYLGTLGEYSIRPGTQWRFVRGKGYIADDLTTQAIDFIERQRAKPFLCISHSTHAFSLGSSRQDWQRFKDRPITSREWTELKKISPPRAAHWP